MKTLLAFITFLLLVITWQAEAQQQPPNTGFIHLDFLAEVDAGNMAVLEKVRAFSPEDADRTLRSVIDHTRSSAPLKAAAAATLLGEVPGIPELYEKRLADLPPLHENSRERGLWMSVLERIRGVENLYRHLNLLAAAGGTGGRPNEMGEPANYPDELCNTKNFVFVHGYNVNPDQARGWAAETFKRLWWSGSRAKYVAVTWHGAETQESTDGAATPNYYVNVDNAFATAEALKNALAALPGEKMVAAHSLGNMLVGSALSDWNAPIEKYIAIDGAVAMESWDGGAAKSNDMVHLDWDNTQTQGTYPERLWASEWHQLWPAGDERSKLTWRERVGNHRSAQVFNFYSSGEEVLAAHPHADMPDILDIATSGIGRYAWALGEKTKGRMHTDLVMGSHSGGWGFSSAYDTTKDAQGNPVYPVDPA